MLTYTKFHSKMVFAKAFTNASNESSSILLICILGNNLKKKERRKKTEKKMKGYWKDFCVTRKLKTSLKCQMQADPCKTNNEHM